VVLFGCRGGAGATTIAINLAASLARAGREACIVDLDLLLGDVLVALDLDPRASVSALAREAPTLDPPALKRRLQRHASGFFAVAQSGRIDDVDAELPERIPGLLRLLASHVDAVLVDGLRDFDDHAVAAMDAADLVSLVFTQDVAGVRRAARIVELCAKLGYPAEKLRLILNRHHSGSKIRVAEIERALGLPIFAHVANDYRATQAAQDAGVILSDLKRSSRVSRDLAALATRLFPVRADDVPPPRPGFFARLFGRR
jgi:pilus assembly protein CpaE